VAASFVRGSGERAVAMALFQSRPPFLKQLLMQATSRLLLGLPVRLLVGGPQMPKNARPAAASLSPSRGSYRGRRDVRVHRPIAAGRSSLPVPRESFHPSVPTLRNLASHPLRRLRSCPSQRGDNAGSIARHTVSKWRSRRARNFFVLKPCHKRHYDHAAITAYWRARMPAPGPARSPRRPVVPTCPDLGCDVRT
jgi:hypothetical protein